jgi:hypothetical protein
MHGASMNVCDLNLSIRMNAIRFSLGFRDPHYLVRLENTANCIGNLLYQHGGWFREFVCIDQCEISHDGACFGIDPLDAIIIVASKVNLEGFSSQGSELNMTRGMCRDDSRQPYGTAGDVGGTVSPGFTRGYFHVLPPGERRACDFTLHKMREG